MFFALPNLISSAVEPCVPWQFTATLPDAVKGKDGKKARDSWINDVTTKHQVYSAYEGFNPSARISDGKAGEEGNPPLKLHAFVADFDAPVTEEELKAGIGRIKFVPNYYERTLSGNARLVWLFEGPVSFPSTKFAVEFAKFAAARMHIDMVAAGWDRPAWETPNRYWTNSGDWMMIDEHARIPQALLNGWVFEVGEKYSWKKDKAAIDIPLPIVWPELQKKYPGASEWQGDFVEGAQGPTFWVDGSTSPKSAIVKPTGLFTFAAHAVKPFYSWADLLGKDFVDKYTTELMGKAVDGIFHDGKSYYRQDGYGEWKCFGKEDLASHLSITRGLSDSRQGGEKSQVARAIEYVQEWRGINGAAPFAFQRSGLIERNGFKYLNTHTRRVLQPAKGPVIWGPNGQMPGLSLFFDTFFHPDSIPTRPLDYYLAWASRFYIGAYTLDLESGQNVFILGPAGVGKTFLNQGLLPYLMGGHAEAEDYLLGKTDFNSQLFETGLWTVDDNGVTVDALSHRKFSSMTKKMAANTTFQYHAKFRVPTQVEWRGRVSITANDDEESARIVPDLSISNLEKNHLFRTCSKPTFVFPDKKGCEKLIRDEAPYLARFLLDYIPPSHVVGTSRFGVVAYHEQTLLKVAEQSSRTAGFEEILEDWKARFFGDHPTAEYWEGTSFQFVKELMKDELTREAGIRTLNHEAVGRHLAALKAKKHHLEARDSRAGRVWRIYRPQDLPGKQLPNGAAKFAK